MADPAVAGIQPVRLTRRIRQPRVLAIVPADKAPQLIVGGSPTKALNVAVLVQRGAPDRIRGRAFAVVMSTGYTVLGLGMIAAGPLTNEVGPRKVWAGAAILIGIAAVVGFLLARRVDAENAPEFARAHNPEPLRD